MVGLLRRYLLKGREIITNDMSIESDASINPIPISAQEVQSTGLPNVPAPYGPSMWEQDIATLPSVVGDISTASGPERTVLPQRLHRQRRTHKQSHIPGPLSSNLPGVLPVYWQRKIQRFYLQRPLADLQRNLRIAIRRR